MPQVHVRDTARRVAAAAWTAACLAGAAPSAAQPPDPEVLGAAVARDLLDAVDLKNLAVQDLVLQDFAEAHDLPTTPGWEGRLREALAEEIEHDAPELERLTGHALARALTQQELRALDRFFESEGGRALLASLGDAAAGLPPTPPTGRARAELDRFLLTPEGRAVQEKIDGVLEALAFDLMAEVAPGAARRFRSKSAGAGD